MNDNAESEEMPVAEEIAAAEIQPTDPADLEKAEQLIRQASVAKMRNQPEIASKLLEEAKTIAPNSAVVLEAVGDDFVARHQFRKAKEAYGQAHKLDPVNQSLENKFAEMVLKVDLHVDPWTLQEADAGTMASGKIAAILSLLIPGLGQAVLGSWVKAVVFFAMWFIGLLFVWASPGGIRGLLEFLFQGKNPADFNPWVFGAVFSSVLGWLMSVFDATAAAKRYKPRKIEKPAPPPESFM